MPGQSGLVICLGALAAALPRAVYRHGEEHGGGMWARHLDEATRGAAAAAAASAAASEPDALHGLGEGLRHAGLNDPPSPDRPTVDR